MESYLGGTAFVQNRGAKPWDRFLRERSQGGPAMGRHEEACSFDQTGEPMSRHEGRVSPSRTKPSLLVSRSSWPTTKAERWPGETVRPALMSGKWFVSLTDEVPRSSSACLISRFYKAQPKGSSDAPAAGTATPWPRSWGCLQRQSMPSTRGGRKAKPQSASNASASSWDKLASAKNGLLRLVLHCERFRLGGSCLAPSAELPILGKSSAPSLGSHAPACERGRLMRENCSSDKYEESTSLRQRGGAGFGLPLTH
jgi:hypothetical protein